MNTILTANHEKGYAINGRGTTYSFPGDAHSLSLNMQQKTSTYTITQDMFSNLSVDDIRLRFDLQERRVRDAERLTIAASAVSASLDLPVALEKGG